MHKGFRDQSPHKKLLAKLTAIASGKSSKDFIHEVVTDVFNSLLVKVIHRVIPDVWLQIRKLKLTKRDTLELGKAIDQVINSITVIKRSENSNALSLLSNE
jgi:hypothetical protein